MKVTKITNINKHIIYIISIIIFFILQSTPALFEIGEVKPHILFACAVVISFLEGEFVGGLYALFIGVLCDTSGYSLFGFNTLFLCAICVCIGIISHHITDYRLFFYLLFTVATCLIILSLHFLFVYGIWRLSDILDLYKTRVVYVSIYTILISPLIYFYFWRIFNKTAKKSAKKNS